MSYLGDFPTGATVYVPFHTFAAAGGSVTITGLAVTDIEIYKDGGTTQRASDAGYTLLDTDGIDVDGITGIHGFKIDLSDNTDAGFYAAGHEYFVVVSSITADSQTVNFVAAEFSIERAGGALELLKNATYGLSAIEGLVDDLESRLTAARAGYLDNLSAGAVALASGVVLTDASSDAVIADAVWNAAKASYGSANTYGEHLEALANSSDPSAATIADAVWDELSTGHTDAGKAGAQMWTDVDAILEDTGTTLDDLVDDLESRLTSARAGYLDKLQYLPAATAGAAGGLFIAGTNAATVITTAGGAALTLSSTGANGAGLSVAGNGSGAGILVAAGATGDGVKISGGATSGDGLHISATDGDGADIRGGGDGDGLSLHGDGSGEGLSAVGGATGDGLKALGGATSGSGIVGQAINEGHGFYGIGDGSGDGMSLVAGATGVQLDATINAAIIDATSDAVIADAVWNAAKASYGGVGSYGEHIEALANSADPSAATIADAVWDELSTGHTDAGKAGAQMWTDVDAILEDTGTTLDDLVDDLESRLTSARAGYLDKLQYLPAATAGTVGGLPTVDSSNYVAGVLALGTQAKADVNAEVVDVLRTDTIPDSYAADGAQPTVVQAILAIQQYLQERSVSGTTVTVKKPNGSTVAMTFTLDDATAPTSQTRAT